MAETTTGNTRGTELKRRYAHSSDESGNRIQKEFPGTESKAETESLLRKAMEDYDNKKFIAKNENVTLSDMLDMWVEEELKPGSLSNGTVMAYQATVRRIKQHLIAFVKGI